MLIGGEKKKIILYFCFYLIFTFCAQSFILGLSTRWCHNTSVDFTLPCVSGCNYIHDELGYNSLPNINVCGAIDCTHHKIKNVYALGLQYWWQGKKASYIYLTRREMNGYAMLHCPKEQILTASGVIHWKVLQ